jgi:hypothetical protein
MCAPFPILIQLPPQSDVLQSLSDALPPVYPTAQPAIDVSLLERMWDYSNTAEASVYKDQLQSRLARLMVLHDLWRGRSWGKQLAWRGRTRSSRSLSSTMCWPHAVHASKPRHCKMSPSATSAVPLSKRATGGPGARRSHVAHRRQILA